MGFQVKFNIKKPKSRVRASFSIVKQVPGKKAETIKDERIDAINRRYKEGSETFENAFIFIKDIKGEYLLNEQRKYPQRVHLKENIRLFDEFWRIHYENRDLVDPNSAKNDFNRAIEALGKLNLLTASQAELQNAIDKQFKDQKQRRVVRCLNQLLKANGRNIKLRKAKQNYKTPKHLTEIELKQVINHVEDEGLRVLYQLAFYSGLREGELFALKANNRHNDIIKIELQVDREGNKRDTKNRLSRKAFLLPQGISVFNKWVAIPEDKKQEYRQKASRVLSSVCQELFNSSEKHCSMHSLRHSYAIHLLGLNATLTHVAQSLGNSISVCQRYYTGFTLSDDSIEMLSRTVTKAMNEK